MLNKMLGLSPTEGFENLLKGPAHNIRELSPHVHGVPEHLGTRQSKSVFSVSVKHRTPLKMRTKLVLGEQLCSVNDYKTLNFKLHKNSTWKSR